MANTIGKAYVQIIPSTEGIGASLTDALSGVSDNAGKKSGSKIALGIGSALKGSAAAIGAGLAAATAGTTAFAKSAVSVGAEFDVAMSQVAATMGSTTDAIAKETVSVGQWSGSLRDLAQKLGSETNFTATQAAEGLNILAMAGFDASESANMLETVLHLAAAGGMDMADSASYIAGAVKGFADNTKDASYYADLMAKGATMANTSVTQLGEAIMAGSATAASYGQSAEDMTVSLLRLAEQGSVGSEAATALNRVMADLYTPTESAAKVMAELGVSAYDAAGNAKDINTVVDELNASLEGMTDAEKNAALNSVLTTKGLAAFNKMTVTSTDKVNEWASSLAGAAGSTKAQYATMTDNLQGDIDIFNSAVDGFRIAISDKLTPTLRSLTQFGSEAMGSLTTAFQSGGLDAAMASLGQSLSQGLAMIMNNLPSLLSAGGSLLTALLNGITQNIPQISTALTTVVTQISGFLMQSFPELLTAGIQILSNILIGISQNLSTMIPTLISTVMTIFNTLIDNLPLLIDAGNQLLFALCDGILTALPDLIAKLPEIITKIIGFFRENSSQIAQVGIQLLGSLVQNLPEIISAIISALPQILVSLLQGFQSMFGDMINAGSNLMLGLKEGIINAAKSILNAAIEVGKTIINGFKNFFGIHSPSTVFAELGGYMMDGLAIGIEDNTSEVRDALDAVGTMATGELDTAMNISTDMANATINHAIDSGTKTQTTDLLIEQNALLRQILDKTGVYLDGRMLSNSIKKYSLSTGV